MVGRIARGDWGSVPLGGRSVSVRALLVAVGAFVWLGSALMATGTAALASAGAALAFLVPLVLVGTLARTVELRRIGVFVLWGGFVVALALLWVILYEAVAPDGGHGRLRATVQPTVEELLKLAPLLVLLWRGRRDRTWSLGATDILLLGAATGAAFGFVEDSYIRSRPPNWTGLGWLPVTQTVAVGTRLIAGHAIWTAIAAGGIGLALLARSRRWLALPIAIVALAWPLADHIANNTINILGRGADDDLFVSVVKTLTDSGFVTVAVFVGVAVLALGADLLILLRTWPGLWARLRPERSAPPILARWELVRMGRAIGFVRWQTARLSRVAGRLPAELAAFDAELARLFAPPTLGTDAPAERRATETGEVGP